jgi:hypothetical protein
MFTKAGDFKVKIIAQCLSDPKFDSAGPGAFDVCLHLQDVADATQNEWWHGEMSQNYGKGSFSDRTQAQITLGTLEKIGFVGGQDMTRLEELIGKETIAHVDSSMSKDGKTYFNVKWIGGGGTAPTAISKDEVKRRMAALMGNVAAPATSAPAAATAAPAKPVGKIPSPF